MSDAHDPAALVRHAVQAGDWRLVELIARMLAASRARRPHGARRAYGTLVVKLGLTRWPSQLRSRLMEEIERARRGSSLPASRATCGTARRLPVPIEEIADTHVGLLVRDVEDLGTAPGAPELGQGQALSGLLLPARRRDLGQRRGGPTVAARDDASRSPMSSDTGDFTETPSARVFCRSGSIEPERRSHARRSRPPRTRPTCSPPQC